jgi:hypothetical protein
MRPKVSLALAVPTHGSRLMVSGAVIAYRGGTKPGGRPLVAATEREIELVEVGVEGDDLGVTVASGAVVPVTHGVATPARYAERFTEGTVAWR